MTVVPLYEGNYAPGTWLPLRVSLRSTSGNLRGRLEASALGGDVLFGADVDLPGGGSKDLTLYVYPFGADTLDIVLRDGSSELARAAAKVRERPGERMVAIVAGQPLNLALPRRQDLTALPFLPFDLPLPQLPDQGLGLSTLATLVLHDVDTTMLSEQQRLALLSWVYNGGQLVLGGGGGAARLMAGLPTPLQPAQVGAPGTLNAAALNSFIAVSGVPSPNTLDGVALAPAAGSSVLIGGESPLVVERAFGSGRVHQLAFAPDNPALASWLGAPRFWDLLLRPLRPDAAVTASQGLWLEDIREQRLTRALGYLPALDLPSPVLLLSLLLIYFVVVGPLAHLLLRRLGIQLWGWLIIPAITLLFAIVTYGLGFTLRASDAILNQVSVVEVIEGGAARIRTLAGVYGSNDDSYQLTFSGTPTLRPLRSTSGPFGPVDGAVGTFTQGSGAVANLRVPPWSMRGLLAETTAAFPTLDAEIAVGPAGITVRVVNPLDQELRDVVVSYGSQLVSLGTIEAKGQAQVAWPDPMAVDRQGLAPLGTSLGFLIYGQAIEEGGKPGNILDRRVLLRQGVVDALISNGPFPRDPGPVLLAWLDSSPLAATSAGSARLAQGQTSLLLARPRISPAQGQVNLGRGWLSLDLLSALQATPCNLSDGGFGLATSSVPLTMTLSLPPGLATLRPDSMSIALDSEREWPNAGISTSLYNWQEGRWEDQNFDGPGDLLVERPERYMRAGRVLLQFAGRIAETGCLQASASVQGTLP